MVHCYLGNKSITPHQPGCSGQPDTKRTGQKSGRENVREGNEGNEKRIKDDRCNEERGRIGGRGKENRSDKKRVEEVRKGMRKRRTNWRKGITRARRACDGKLRRRAF